MSNLVTVEMKAFVPARDFDLSKRFYQDLGFELKSSSDDIANLCHGHCAFQPQRLYVKSFAENLMLHLLVADAEAWRTHVEQHALARKYEVEVGALEARPWGMRDFTLTDPSGVLWRIAQNV
jgi:catechol 2,3-dioxygenase-like lactoylglutathione lyase family enzyme